MSELLNSGGLGQCNGFKQLSNNYEWCYKHAVSKVNVFDSETFEIKPYKLCIHCEKIFTREVIIEKYREGPKSLWPEELFTNLKNVTFKRLQ